MKTVARLFLWAPWVLGAALAWGPTQAQSPAPTKRDGAELSDTDRAKRDADKVFSFIKFHAVRPAAPAPAPKAAAARPAESARAAVVAASPASAPARDPAAVLAAAPTAGGLTPAEAVVPTTAAVEPNALPAPSLDPVPAAPTVAEPSDADLVELTLVHHVQPDLSPSRVEGLRSGDVWVQFTVQPDGKPSQVFARPGAQGRLARLAVRAVEQWRFQPIPAPQEVMVKVAFQLD